MSYSGRDRVTVIILTYNANKKKALETINSVIMQRKVDLQVIIADDCSKDNNFDEYRHFFYKKGFDQYILLESETNRGTVKNIQRCIEKCKGTYIKLISPGDYLYGESILYDWVQFMKKNELDMSVADALYYERNGNDYRIVREHAFPQAPKVLNGSNEREKKYYQLIYNDYWLGAATIISIEEFKKYIPIVSKLAQYGEDNMYRIAACDGIKRGYYPRVAVMYETDTGISSLGDKGKRWHSILMKEWMETSDFIADRLRVDKSFEIKFAKFVNWKRQNENIRESKLKGKNPIKLIVRLLPLYIAIPDMFVWNIRRVLLPRKTPNNVDDGVVRKIFEI